MITLTAKINLLSGDNKDLELSSTSLLGNNISSKLESIVGFDSRRKAKNPFLLGVTKFYEMGTFSNTIDYFIGRTVSNKAGLFDVDYVFTISSKIGAYIKSLTFAFDTMNNSHPKSIIIDGKEYIDDDAVFTIANLENQIHHIVRIRNWNKVGHPIIITGIYSEINIEINRRNIIQTGIPIADRSDLKLPSFGIISNTGSIEFNDLDGEIKDYAEQLLLQSGLKCEIKLNNTLVDSASQTIAVMETDEWDYDNDNRVVRVSLKDDLEEWQDINVAEISYDPRKQESKPFKWLYKHLWAITTANKNYDMLSFDELDTETQEILGNTYIQYPLLKSGSLWVQWTKLCEVCQLHIYKDNNGIVVCRYNGGN